jgi:hypothetical protein
MPAIFNNPSSLLIRFSNPSIYLALHIVVSRCLGNQFNEGWRHTPWEGSSFFRPV